jgi:hypothetical protein
VGAVILAYHTNHPTRFARDEGQLVEHLCQRPIVTGATLWNVNINQVAPALELLGIEYRHTGDGVYLLTNQDKTNATTDRTT